MRIGCWYAQSARYGFNDDEARAEDEEGCCLDVRADVAMDGVQELCCHTANWGSVDKSRWAVSLFFSFLRSECVRYPGFKP